MTEEQVLVEVHAILSDLVTRVNARFTEPKGGARSWDGTTHSITFLNEDLKTGTKTDGWMDVYAEFLDTVNSDDMTVEIQFRRVGPGLEYIVDASRNGQSRGRNLGEIPRTIVRSLEDHAEVTVFLDRVRTFVVGLEDRIVKELQSPDLG